MRKLKKIYVHCSATKEGVDFGVEWVRQLHLARGFRDIGYHFVITLDGTVHKGRPLDQMGAHVKGDNTESIGICYIGGLDISGNPMDTRTPYQRQALKNTIRTLRIAFPEIEQVLGHRDASPDLNHDGEITPDEWLKACPCFSVLDEIETYQV